eukprot:1832393-Ditylum_brightwellii.AAC.1
MKKKLSLTLSTIFILCMLKAAMRKTSLTIMILPMWTITTVPLLVSSAILIVTVTTSEWQTMT